MKLPDNSDTACLIKADWLEDRGQAAEAQDLREEVAEGPNIGGNGIGGVSVFSSSVEGFGVGGDANNGRGGIGGDDFGTSLGVGGGVSSGFGGLGSISGGGDVGIGSDGVSIGVGGISG